MVVEIVLVNGVDQNMKFHNLGRFNVFDMARPIMVTKVKNKSTSVSSSSSFCYAHIVCRQKRDQFKKFSPNQKKRSEKR